ncbi:MAG: hypothetical protein QXP73_05050 [Candidatus Methanomethylicaceae archaeon]|nr:hypothetical protein [Candidatus Verstraetearchaeota archaeon]
MRGFKINKIDRRGEISTPIITILVTVAALAVTGMAITWMASTGSAASMQGALIIIGTPVVQNDTLYMTLKNIGTADANLVSCTLNFTISSNFIPSTIKAGESVALQVKFSQSFAHGQTIKGSLSTNQGTLQFSAFSQ